MAFGGYYNLMNHRKKMHPSNKKCRNFSSGNCPFNSDCWYVHDNTMDSDVLCDRFKCNFCDFEVQGRDAFMKHMKKNHIVNVQTCEKFMKNDCVRDDHDCWFEHPVSQSEPKDPAPTKNMNKLNQEEVFCEAPGDSMPPDHMKRMLAMVSDLCNKMEKMERKFEDLME